MAGNLGRDKLPWGADIWSDIDRAVQAEVGQIRVLQKVLPATLMEGASVVPADKVDFESMTIEEGLTKPFLEISVEFRLTQSQVENEATLHTARTLARLGARKLALTEDPLIFQGKTAATPSGVRVIHRPSAEDGLMSLGGGTSDGPIIVDESKVAFPEALFLAVVAAIAKLTAEGQPGPYALFLATDAYAEAHRPSESMATPADRIAPLVTGGFYTTGTLSKDPLDVGLILSLGGAPTSIYLGQDAVVAFTQADTEGNYCFRVYERVQYVARDPGAGRVLRRKVEAKT